MNEMKNYKIEVSTTPNYKDHKYKPYYWVLFACSGGECCNECCGWAESPHKAWEEAYEFYKTFKEGNSK